MKVTNGVAMLELKIQGFGLNPTILWDEEMAVLIDTGMPGQFEQIKLAMNEIGISFDQLKAIILTHQDLDHIGSLPEILNNVNHNIEVYAHELDKPYIEGTFPLLKTDPNQMSKEEWDALPAPMQFLYKNPPKAIVNHTLENGQILPFCNGVQVIFTPGHTPGHISLYLKESKTLVAGDAMVLVNGMLRGPIEQTTLNMEDATQSLSKFVELDIKHVICYHGGLYEMKDPKAIENLFANK